MNMAMMPDNFAIFILSHGRADRVYTYRTLQRHGYTGKIFIIVDDEDEQLEKYLSLYGDIVIPFSKKEVPFLTCDNFYDDTKTVIFARNATFRIAAQLGIEYFVQLDDDYKEFSYKIPFRRERRIKNLDLILIKLLEFYKRTPFHVVSIAQGGDFIGWDRNKLHSFHKSYLRIRKMMNFWLCSIHRPFQIIGRMNDDTNVYTYQQSIGILCITIPYLMLNQTQIQKNPGGLTDMYLRYGTYVKTFYTVMLYPSAVKISVMGAKHKRFHHKVNWRFAIPHIISPVNSAS